MQRMEDSFRWPSLADLLAIETLRLSDNGNA